MSLNKLTSSTDYLAKQYLNVGCNDIKCTTLSVGGSPISLSNEYTPVMVAETPADMVLTPATVSWHIFGEYMTLSFLNFDLLLPNGSVAADFEVAMPAGYIGAGAGLANVSIVGQAVKSDGTLFLPIQSQFSADNTKINIDLVSTAAVSGLFDTSLVITCKVVKL
jgi:hypothetical protein